MYTCHGRRAKQQGAYKVAIYAHKVANLSITKIVGSTHTCIWHNAQGVKIFEMKYNYHIKKKCENDHGHRNRPQRYSFDWKCQF